MYRAGVACCLLLVLTTQRDSRDTDISSLCLCKKKPELVSEKIKS